MVRVMAFSNDDMKADMLKEVLAQIAVIARQKGIGRDTIALGRLWIKTLCKLRIGMLRRPFVSSDNSDGTLGLTFSRENRFVEIVFDDNPSMICTLNRDTKHRSVTWGDLPESEEELLSFWEWITT